MRKSQVVRISAGSNFGLLLTAAGQVPDACCQNIKHLAYCTCLLRNINVTCMIFFPPFPCANPYWILRYEFFDRSCLGAKATKDSLAMDRWKPKSTRREFQSLKACKHMLATSYHTFPNTIILGVPNYSCLFSPSIKLYASNSKF